MKRRKSYFAITKKGHWWVRGVGWVHDDLVSIYKAASRSSHRPGPKTLNGAERMSKGEQVEINVFYRRRGGWLLRYSFGD